MNRKACIPLLWSLGLSSVLAAGQLHTAVSTEPLERIRTLVDQGEPVNEPDAAGATPLMLAVAAGRLDVVNLLLGRGADPAVRNAAGRTATDLCQDRMLEAGQDPGGAPAARRDADAEILQALLGSQGPGAAGEYVAFARAVAQKEATLLQELSELQGMLGPEDLALVKHLMSLEIDDLALLSEDKAGPGLQDR